MKHRLLISLFLGLMLTAGWGVTGYKKSRAMAVGACVPVGRIISVQGEVQLKRQSWKTYHPTAIGTLLCPSDLLFPSKGAVVKVYCTDPNQNLWTVTPGVPSGASAGCKPAIKPTYRITRPIAPPRNPSAHSIPYIISPFRTWLLNPRPKLHWQAVPGATIYTVRLSGPGFDWETEVKTTSVVYFGKPPLKPVEGGYLLTVEADNGEAPAKTTFGLLDENQAQYVRVAEFRLARQNLTDEAKTLALAELYIGQRLMAEATELLEAAAAKNSQTAVVYQMLSDLYARAELYSQAENNYLKAVSTATTSKDIEGQAVAATRLGELYKVIGHSAQADHWMKMAKLQYQAL